MRMTFKIDTYGPVDMDVRMKTGDMTLRSISETPQFMEMEILGQRTIVLIEDLCDIVGHLNFNVD